jgi:anti-sigma factor RsiW
MNCEHYQTLFSDYERNALGAQAAQDLSAHLQTCEHCAAMLASVQQLRQLLDIQHTPSPGAEARFRARLQREGLLVPPQKASAAITSGSRSFAAVMQQWWHKYWPSQPLGAFSYSVALLVMGLAGGQYLPARSFGFGADPGQLAEQNLSRERLIQLCNVPPQPALNICSGC